MRRFGGLCLCVQKEDFFEIAPKKKKKLVYFLENG